MRSTSAIDTAVVDKTEALTNALDAHAVSFRETIGRQATVLDEALMHGINSVRRASENITRQSIKAMEGLAGQSDLLKNISENLLNQISGVTGRFENQGQQIMKAANALETANFKIDKTLQNRHAELTQTLDRLSGKADEFSTFVGDYSSTIEGSLSEADLRARSELERMRAHTSAESERTLEDLRHRLTSVSTTMTTELGSLSNRFAATSEEMRQQAARAAADIAGEQERLRTEVERLPVAAHESSEGMRRALHDQIKALDQLSQLAARSAVQRDVTPPPHAEALPPNAHAPRGRDQARSLTSLSSTIAQELGNRQRQRGAAPDNREGWSLGDLLARASRDEEGHGHSGGAPRQAQAAFNLDLEAIARALDPATAAAIWQRLRSGQRGVMVRSIYGNEGRAVFDDVSHRCRNDGELSRTVSRYLADFERIVSESDQRDPTGRLSHGQLVSDTGRVYLLLAHASGRLG
jgi:predicted pyridoxine 5'-phosphate oxidase superfamily flavin-nucleotide-binding protein